MIKKYRLFLLCVQSCIELPEAPVITDDTPPDVIVEFKAIETSARPAPGEPLNKFGFLKMEGKRVLFASMAGMYEIKDGNYIAIDPDPNVTPEQIRLFFLGSCMGILLSQRDYLPFHGGSIVANGGAVIITGHAGAGKSTMTSTLVSNGFPYLTDDVSCLVQEGEGFCVLPSYPQRKLVYDACITLGYNPEELPVVDPVRNKFAVRDIENHYDKPAPLTTILRLVSVGADERVCAKPITGIGAIDLIVENLYRSFLHMEKGNYTPTEFKRFLMVATSVKMYEISIPRNIDKIKGTAEELAQLMGWEI